MRLTLAQHYENAQTLMGKRRHEGSIYMICDFAGGLPQRILSMPYDRLALEMENGIVLYVRDRLTPDERSLLIKIRFYAFKPYEPYPCESCGKPTDCREDSWLHCSPQLDGESYDRYWDRVIRPRMDAHAGVLLNNLNYADTGTSIDYALVSGDLIIDMVADEVSGFVN